MFKERNLRARLSTALPAGSILTVLNCTPNFTKVPGIKSIGVCPKTTCLESNETARVALRRKIIVIKERTDVGSKEIQRKTAQDKSQLTKR
jgi:hypothetical protein